MNNIRLLKLVEAYESKHYPSNHPIHQDGCITGLVFQLKALFVRPNVLKLSRRNTISALISFFPIKLEASGFQIERTQLPIGY